MKPADLIARQHVKENKFELGIKPPTSSRGGIPVKVQVKVLGEQMERRRIIAKAKKREVENELKSSSIRWF
ncbi:hypothetical protein TNCV_289441 [Trichonephila clavipes]|nr:hypothetical protein TNCV_289441 [Trichonephila clavipes]